MTDQRVCFVGDSYVAGVGDPTALGWVGRVAAAAVSAGLPTTSYNLGVRGQTGPEIAARILTEVPPRLDAAGDPRLVVSFGANDTVEVDGRRRTTLADSVAALERIRGSISVPLLVVGPPAVGDLLQNQRLAQLDAALHGAAIRRGVPYVGLFARTSDSQLWRHEVVGSDGYHPGADGYDLLARIVAPDILRWLRSTS
ncbi:GDSL-type esterase/lipase family protein [Demequina iriomotensis]|uniref:GDSL-type esterase/lipase family protein n=1 Tax=Demequina iriomotensis TaxID=1536641 RepID=UPI000784B5F4|nr:GDSL-type esterase/lipase family protein [Demequina iriomotensis]